MPLVDPQHDNAFKKLTRLRKSLYIALVGVDVGRTMGGTLRGREGYRKTMESLENREAERHRVKVAQRQAQPPKRKGEADDEYAQLKKVWIAEKCLSELKIYRELWDRGDPNGTKTVANWAAIFTDYFENYSGGQVMFVRKRGANRLRRGQYVPNLKRIELLNTNTNEWVVIWRA